MESYLAILNCLILPVFDCDVRTAGQLALITCTLNYEHHCLSPSVLSFSSLFKERWEKSEGRTEWNWWQWWSILLVHCDVVPTFKLLSSRFKVCNSLRHRTIQINHQPDATIFQFIILTFIYSSTCFGRSPAHHQELNDWSSSLWFYLRIVVIAVLCSWSGRPALISWTLLMLICNSHTEKSRREVAIVVWATLYEVTCKGWWKQMKSWGKLQSESRPMF